MTKRKRLFKLPPLKKLNKKQRLLLAAGALTVLGGVAYSLATYTPQDGHNAPCPEEGATACVNGQAYDCQNGVWVQGGSGCINDICAIKECPGYCDGTNLMSTGTPRCANIAGEAVCQYVVSETNSRYCQFRYPTNIFLKINGQDFDPGWVYMGGDAYCPENCDHTVAGYGGKNGIDLDIDLIVKDQWGDPMDNVHTTLDWICDDNLMGVKLWVGTDVHCSGYYWVCDPKQYNLYSDSGGHSPVHFTQLYCGATNTPYRLILTFHIHDPNGIRADLVVPYTIKFMGLGTVLFGPNYTCQLPQSPNFNGGC